MRYDSYRFSVIKNESKFVFNANKIAVSRYIIFEKIELIELKIAFLNIFELK